MKKPTAEQVVGWGSALFVAVIFLARDVKDFGWWGVILTVVTLAFAWAGWKAGKKSLGKYGEKDERILHIRDRAAAIAYLVAIYVMMIILLLDEFFKIQLAMRTALWITIGISAAVYAIYYYIQKRR